MHWTSMLWGYSWYGCVMILWSISWLYLWICFSIIFKWFIKLVNDMHSPKMSFLACFHDFVHDYHTKCILLLTHIFLYFPPKCRVRFLRWSSVGSSLDLTIYLLVVSPHDSTTGVSLGVSFLVLPIFGLCHFGLWPFFDSWIRIDG